MEKVEAVHVLDLEKLEALEKAATPGPWEWFEDEMFESRTIVAKKAAREGDTYDDPEIWSQGIITTDSGHYGPRENDRALIAALRNAAPALIAAARECASLRRFFAKRKSGAWIAFDCLSEEAYREQCSGANARLNAAYARIAELESIVGPIPTKAS